MKREQSVGASPDAVAKRLAYRLEVLRKYRSMSAASVALGLHPGRLSKYFRVHGVNAVQLQIYYVQNPEPPSRRQ